jgi:hypothetical protein
MEVKREHYPLLKIKEKKIKTRLCQLTACFSGGNSCFPFTSMKSLSGVTPQIYCHGYGYGERAGKELMFPRGKISIYVYLCLYWWHWGLISGPHTC